MINRVLSRRVDKVSDMLPDMNIWPDNMDTGAWYYFDIQEASNSHLYERKAGGISGKWLQKLENPKW